MILDPIWEECQKDFYEKTGPYGWRIPKDVKFGYRADGDIVVLRWTTVVSPYLGGPPVRLEETRSVSISSEVYERAISFLQVRASVRYLADSCMKNLLIHHTKHHYEFQPKKTP